MVGGDDHVEFPRTARTKSVSAGNGPVTMPSRTARAMAGAIVLLFRSRTTRARLRGIDARDAIRAAKAELGQALTRLPTADSSCSVVSADARRVGRCTVARPRAGA
jgi:hypothetical protein